MDITMRTRGWQQVAALARRFDRAAATLSYRIDGALLAEAEEAVTELRAAWRGIEVTSTRGGGSSSGLRGRVAAATQARAVRGGVVIEVDAARVDPAYGGTLTRGLDGLGRWRHPVWGHRDRWTQQQGEEVFYRTLRNRPWESRLERVVDQTAREIED